LYNAFEDGDERREATILAPGEHIQFMSHDIHYAVNPSLVYSESSMTNRKFMSIFADSAAIGKLFNVSGNNQSNRLAVHIMRYADILLMKAEALIWKNEDLAEAKRLIDLVRDRAGLSETFATTQDDLKTALKKERRLEFAFEFFPSRHFDLVRWGDAEETYKKPTEGWQDLKISGGIVVERTEKEVRPSRVFDPNKNHVFPIPDAEIRKSKNLKQNEGY
jgi:hypothetical protein